MCVKVCESAQRVGEFSEFSRYVLCPKKEGGGAPNIIIKVHDDVSLAK